ncbi:hypothetical protein CNY89_17655 [Amaricoccus sp. HAR-UPW-R2A-40]|nr:hypothetical protein CNY89_17655 [Amaricoccus sp. HAR-UPW-R2A-40]
MTAMLDTTLEEDPVEEVAPDIVPGLDAEVVLETPAGGDPVEGVPEASDAARVFDVALLGAGESAPVEQVGHPGVIHGEIGADRIFGGDLGETICAGLGEDDVDGGAGSRRGA